MARRPPGLAARLFLAQVLVLAVGAVTITSVAAAVGPEIFHSHLGRAGPDVPMGAARHAEEAFRSASALSLTVALLAALVAALAVSAYAARRFAGPVTTLAGAARAVAGADYGVRVPAGGMGPEFESVGAAFNTMASRLEEVERARRRLLADMAHEMRTPLATLEAYVEGLADGVVEPGDEPTEVMQAQVARLRRLADDITAVSRAEEHQLDLQRRTVHPGDLVTGAVTAARDRYAAKGVRLVEDAAPRLPSVDVDPDRMGQVLGNLLDNALRHTPAGGQVTVSARAEVDAVVLAVTDTGEGIAAEHLPHVFERFYRADAARDRGRGGSGIGLAIARAIVETHGGRMTASSPGPGGGAMFTITLPPAGS